ncbi:MAG: hypothetical protein U9P42_02730, partial [Candidatus Fermentibacteria bacterium]|nr:hypothetical protein [Candidatus Fermentibacteria bacterium]
KSSFPITAATTGKELYFRMVEEGMNLFTRCYPDLASGRALQMTRVQDSSVAVTHYRKELTHQVHPSTEFINSVRALTFRPFPPPFFIMGNRRFIIIEELKEEDR